MQAQNGINDYKLTIKLSSFYKFFMNNISSHYILPQNYSHYESGNQPKYKCYWKILWKTPN